MISPIKPINAVRETISSVQPKLKSLPDSFEHCKSFAEKEVEKFKAWGNFIKIKCLEHLNTFEKIALKNTIENSYELDFYQTLFGTKPSCFISGTKNLGFLKKISLENKNLEAINYKRHGFQHAIILNKESVNKIINENKDIFTDRLKLPENTPVGNIYSKLKTALKQSDYDELLGITLGFPRKDSIIFGLEQGVKKTKNIDPVELRKDVPKFKEEILEFLDSKDCPYKDSRLKEEIKEIINNISDIKPCNKKYYKYIKYTNDSDVVIDKSIKDFEENFTYDKLL